MNRSFLTSKANLKGTASEKWCLLRLLGLILGDLVPEGDADWELYLQFREIVDIVFATMSPKKWSKNTFGWARAEVLGALVNAVFLVALCFSILVESLKRFYKPEVIDEPKLILYVGVAGLLVNLIGLFLFREHGHSHSRGHHHSLPTVEETDTQVTGGQLNIRGVYLHILADALGSVVVIISSLIIWLTTWEHRYYVDPALRQVAVR
ncbi:hypothetical protein HPB47_017056, partial [Ixodes persulcatus]